MSVIIREYHRDDVEKMIEIWNEVVEEGAAFPQTDLLDIQSGNEFFAQQSLTAVAEEAGEILGLYILHPNNIGRCGHLSNASFAVASSARGKGVGKMLVSHCLDNAGRFGYKILQFNAVVADNHAAIGLYKSLGFVELGTIPGGFLKKNNEYEDIILFYHRV